MDSAETVSGGGLDAQPLAAPTLKCSSNMRRQPDTAEGVGTLLRSLREASATMLAAVATLLCALAIDPGPGPAVLAVVLCLSLSRSQLDRDRRGRVEAAIVLPAVGLVAVGAILAGTRVSRSVRK